jgi:hypothetical protein
MRSNNLRMIPLLALATLALAGCVAEPPGYPYYGAAPVYGYAPYAYPVPAYGSFGFVYGGGWRHDRWRGHHHDWGRNGGHWHHGGGGGHGGGHHR